MTVGTNTLVHCNGLDEGHGVRSSFWLPFWRVTSLTNLSLVDWGEVAQLKQNTFEKSPKLDPIFSAHYLV